MCGECGDGVPGEIGRDGGQVSCQDAQGNPNVCGLRFLYCLQPYKFPARDVPFLPQNRLIGSSESITFQESFFFQRILTCGSGQTPSQDS